MSFQLLSNVVLCPKVKTLQFLLIQFIVWWVSSFQMQIPKQISYGLLPIEALPWSLALLRVLFFYYLILLGCSVKKLDSVVIFICISRDTFFFCPASSSHNDHFSFYEILASQQRQTECTEILKANAGTFTYKIGYLVSEVLSNILHDMFVFHSVGNVCCQMCLEHGWTNMVHYSPIFNGYINLACHYTVVYDGTKYLSAFTAFMCIRVWL